MYFKELISEKPSLVYTNVFPRVPTREFLEGVYGGEYKDFVERVAKNNPWTYYTVGIIRRDGKGTIEEVVHDIDLKDRTWQDRIDLHREIANHGSKK